ncbi:Rieske 2Fe-2S domain-containing protein [Streptomyces sp. MAR4 CNX-425]|uniref:Rieske 2Fe-2S domain-containing protein n=1 Tax=Streptomyces sp. MAR4 CNX-425 TaxID=3406343 RepID=UPI003B50477D
MIPNQWYPIARTKDLRKKKPTGMTRLGERLVAWRDIDGNAVVQSARCPHKGADLGAGRINRNAVECPYHGFRFGPDGACTAVPCLGRDAHIPKSLRIFNYPVRERHDLVWMWWGERRAEADLPDLDVPPEITRWKGVHITGSWSQPVHYTRYIESMLEFYHAPWVHRGSWFNYLDYMFLYGTARKLGLDGRQRYFEACRVTNHRTEVDADGTTLRSSFELGREDDPDSGEPLKIVFTFPGTVHVINRKFDITMWLTPIDDDHTQVLFRWYEAESLAPYLRSRTLRAAAPGIALGMQRWIGERQDMRVVLGQEPKISQRGESRFVAADEMNARYLSIRAKLIQQAHRDAAPAGPVPAEPAGDPAAHVAPADPAPSNGAAHREAAANGSGVARRGTAAKRRAAAPGGTARRNTVPAGVERDAG